MAILTGRLAKERPPGPIDRTPFIWKDFSAAGYRTFVAEDGFIDCHAFNSYVPGHRLGFVSVPTDYYLRPLNVAMHRNHKLLDRRSPAGRKCTGPILEDELILNWVSTVSPSFFCAFMHLYCKNSRSCIHTWIFS